MTLIEAAVRDGYLRGLSDTFSQVRALKQIKNLTELGPESWERISNRSGALEMPTGGTNPQLIAVPRQLVVAAIDAFAELGHSMDAGELQDILEKAR